MCDFKPGDEVVCVVDGPWWGRAPRWMFWTRKRKIPGPVKGRVYVVDRVGWGTNFLTDERLYSIVVRGVEGGWHHANFRKVQRRDLGAWLQTSVSNTDKLDKPRRVREPQP